MKFGKKFKNTINKEFDSDPATNEKFLKAKTKSYNGKINTNFHNNKIPEEGSQFTCLSVILIDPVFRTGNNYYPQVFLEECKYIVKEEKMSEYIIDNIEISDKENSDEETSDDEILVKEILIKKILMKKILMKKILKILVW